MFKSLSIHNVQFVCKIFCWKTHDDNPLCQTAIAFSVFWSIVNVNRRVQFQTCQIQRIKWWQNSMIKVNLFTGKLILKTNEPTGKYQHVASLFGRNVGFLFLKTRQPWASLRRPLGCHATSHNTKNTRIYTHPTPQPARQPLPPRPPHSQLHSQPDSQLPRLLFPKRHRLSITKSKKTELVASIAGAPWIAAA